MRAKVINPCPHSDLILVGNQLDLALSLSLCASRSLARHGAKVLLADVDFAAAKLSSDELEGAGFQATAVECNVCSKDEVCHVTAIKPAYSHRAAKQ